MRAPRRLLRRHHLRHQPRVRLRLPARQHGGRRLEGCVQRELRYAIVDEVDNILIDEARTPLIISGPAEDSTARYQTFARAGAAARASKRTTRSTRRHARCCSPRAASRRSRSCSNIDNIYAPENYRLTRYMEAALKAQIIYKRDRRLRRQGRRGRDRRRLHRPPDVRPPLVRRPAPGGRGEGRRADPERDRSRYATITLQNYFRLYDKLAGMTGTAATEARGVLQDLQAGRRRHPDQPADGPRRQQRPRLPHREGEVQRRRRRDRRAAGAGPARCSSARSRSRSRSTSRRLLEAPGHPAPGAERQAARAGSGDRRTGRPLRRRHDRHEHGRTRHRHRPRRQAGRDAPEEWQAEHDRVVEAGGLEIIGTERHESRRIDNQLRGRAGRQGDPGSSRFFVSLRGRHHAPVRAGLAAGHDGAARHGRRHADRERLGEQGDRDARRRRSRATTSTSARTSSTTTT